MQEILSSRAYTSINPSYSLCQLHVDKSKLHEGETTKKLKWSDVYEPKHTGHKCFFQNAFLLVRRSDERLSKHQTSAMFERELSNENNCLL